MKFTTGIAITTEFAEAAGELLHHQNSSREGDTTYQNGSTWFLRRLPNGNVSNLQLNAGGAIRNLGGYSTITNTVGVGAKALTSVSSALACV